MIVNLKAVSDEKRADDGRLMRQDLFKSCRTGADQMGDDMVGFAIVVWDKNGGMWTSYNAARGPIGPSLVPTLVSDALNRHVAVKLAEARIASEPI